MESFHVVSSKGIDAADNCISGDNNYFVYYLRGAFSKAKKVDIIVSFLIESDVRIIEEDLRSIRERNIPIRIFIGNYLNINSISGTCFYDIVRRKRI